MQALADTVMLDLWTRGARSSVAQRALLMAQLACGDADARALSLGERDRALLALRAANFGAHMEAVTPCAACGETLEFGFDIQCLLAALPAPAQQRFRLADGRELRLPQAGDLLALPVHDLRNWVQQLVQRCSLDSAHGIQDEAQLAEIETCIATLDPATDIQLAYTCPHCAHLGTERLDVVAWLWDELSQRAQRLLDEVHCLASHYGWDEDRILALGDSRRRAYLERCLA